MLKSYSYCQDESVFNRVWGLFGEHPEYIEKTDCSIELIEGALGGRVVYDRSFDILAYDAKVRCLRDKAAWDTAKKFVAISSDSEEEGLAESVVTAYADTQDDYEELLDKEELQWAVRRIREMRDTLLIEEMLDIVCTVRQALIGIPDSIRALKNLASKNSEVAECLRVLLESGKTAELLSVMYG